ncbi:IS66 family insertion sequence element accessory protein TnpA [Paraburkholderia azotifigens]|uniref:IS66 family insertion sequence element accessory protein TnpA n=1 Tax=Paraburkholderia azotifigens TaxID=2057004 RepID=UPI003B8A7E6F
MVVAWRASGSGARRFCREQGLAVSTFGLWRKKLAEATTAPASSLAMTPGRCVCRRTFGRNSSRDAVIERG